MIWYIFYGIYGLIVVMLFSCFLIGGSGLGGGGWGSLLVCSGYLLYGLYK